MLRNMFYIFLLLNEKFLVPMLLHVISPFHYIMHHTTCKTTFCNIKSKFKFLPLKNGNEGNVS